MEGDGRIDDMFFQRLAVFDLEDHLGFVLDAHDRAMGLPEEGGQPLELALLPFREGVVVALSAIDPLTEKRARRASRQLIPVKFAVGHGRRDVIRRGVIGPKTGLGNDLPSHFIVRRVLCELLPQPIDKSIPPINDDLADVSADVAPRQSLGEIVGKAIVGQETRGPAIQASRCAVRLEFANLLERRDRAAQGERKSAEDLQLVGTRRGG